MGTRKLEEQIELRAAPEDVFALLCRPSAVRAWWGASRAVILPQRGGVWAAAWGDDEDSPDYVSGGILREYDPPRRLLMTDQSYSSKSEAERLEGDVTTEFIVEAKGAVTLLRVVQEGFPVDPSADAMYSACRQGWQDVLSKIKEYVEADR